MEKSIKDCKTFSEIYEVLGEKKCAKGAYYVLMAWMLVPVFMVCFNVGCHSKFPNLWDWTLALIFSAFGMAVTVVGILGLAYFVCYIGAKKKAENIRIKDYIYDKKKNEVWILALLGMLIWSGIATILSEDIYLSFFGTEIRHDGFLMYVIYAGAFGCAYMIKKSEMKEKCYLFLTIVADILAVVMICGEHDYTRLSLGAIGYDTSIFGNSNHYAYFLTIATMCVIGLYYISIERIKSGKKQCAIFTFLAISVALQIFAVVKINTLGAYLGIAISLMLSLLIWKKRTGKLNALHFVPLLILILFTFLNEIGVIKPILRGTVWNSLKELIRDIFKISSGSPDSGYAGTNRIGLWIESFKIIGKHPLFGIGPEMAQGVFYSLGESDRPHNEYIQHALFCGVPAAAMYLFALISLCVNRVKNLRRLSLQELVAAFAVIAYTISAFFGNTMFYTTPYFFIMLGFVAGIGGIEVEKMTLSAKEEIKEDKVIKPRIRKKADSSTFITAILSAWGILPAVVSLGFIPISLLYENQGSLILAYEQIMYNFALAAVIGMIGFCGFIYIQTKKREKADVSTKEMFDAKLKKEIWIVLLVALLGWSLISSLLAEDVVTAFIGTAIKRDGFLAYCMYASIMGLAYFVKEERSKKIIFGVFVAVADYMVLVMMCYEWRIPYLRLMSHGYSCATYMNPNHYGYYICMATMCLIGLFYSDLMREKKKGDKLLTGSGVFWLLSMIWQMYALMINNTLGAYVAVWLAMIAMFVLWRINKGRFNPFMLLPFVILIVITWLSYINVITNLWGQTIGNCLGQLWRDLFTVVEHAEGFEQAGTNRMGLWIATLKLIPKHPIFGVGPEGLNGVFREVNVYDRPHNEYLQMAAFCGIPALVLYLSALISLCVNRCKNLKKLSGYTLVAAGVVIGYLISAFFGFTIYYTTPYFYMFLGFVAGSVRESGLDETKAEGRKEESDEKE